MKKQIKMLTMINRKNKTDKMKEKLADKKENLK